MNQRRNHKRNKQTSWEKCKWKHQANQNLWDTMKVALREKFRSANAYAKRRKIQNQQSKFMP